MMNILFILFTAILLIPLDFEFTASDIKAVFETKHSRNTRKAEAFNQEMWESGFADIYTIKATIEVNDEIRSITADVICAPKIETQGMNIKDGPHVWDLTFVFNPPEIYIQISENYRVKFDMVFSCDSFSQISEKQGFPFTDRSYLVADVQHTVEPVASCRLSIYEGAISFKGLKILPMEVVSVRKVRVRDVLTREEYGPADRSIARKLERGKPSNNKIQFSYKNIFFWDDNEMCWRVNLGIYKCASSKQKVIVQKFCPSIQ